MHNATRTNFDLDNVRQRIHNWTIFILTALLSVTTIVLTSFTDTDECKRLEDGKYKVQFKRFPESNFVLLINKNEFIRTDKGGRQTTGTIEWNGDCYFILSTDTVTMGNPVMEKIKLGMGNPCYELTKTRGRVTSFRITRSGNLSILIDYGKLKKMD